MRGTRMALGQRALWHDLSLDVAPGEFVAILGPNGAGKSTLLKVLLGLLRLTAGSLRIAGAAPRRGSPLIGYIPQRSTLGSELSVRGRDLVGLGWDGHQLGMGLRDRRLRRDQVDRALDAVGAASYANRPIRELSGGELQRLRVGQALVGDPVLLLCDEALLSLDLAHQQSVTHLINERRRVAHTAVLFVTHELNPVLPLVDRVLYLVEGRFRVGTPAEVMTSEVLSDLYRTPIDVISTRGRLLVIGADDQPVTLPGHHVHHAEERSHP